LSTKRLCLFIAAMLAMAAMHAMAEGKESNSLAEAIGAGKAGVAIRYRYEHVDQDGFVEDANASTVRLRLNYGTAAWRDWEVFGEFDYIGELFVDDFNSGSGTSPGRMQYPVVADPEGADLNQLYAEYQGLAGWRWRFGRQRILLDDQRFVGGVGWRQNEQTFDAVSVLNKSLAKSEVVYAFVGNTNRIFGDSVPAGDHRMNTHLFNARFKLNDRVSATPYAYYIDNEDDPAASTATFGLRLAGNWPFGDSKLSYVTEVARQSDAANAPVEFDADYLRLDAQWTFRSSLALGVGFELLGGSRFATGEAFRTPLATLHAFQGWADQFLVTPDGGIEDFYGTLAYTIGTWQLQVVYHDFSAESGNADFGSEWDLSLGHKFAEHYSILFKAALFDAEDPPFADTRKYWVMLTADY
jgi:hypothetical protein